jgi:hypothetical protein
MGIYALRLRTTSGYIYTVHQEAVDSIAACYIVLEQIPNISKILKTELLYER